MYLNAEAGQRSGVPEQGFFNRFLFANLKKNTQMWKALRFTWVWFLIYLKKINSS